MRKYQQKQIFELLETLYEAQAAGLYADCQDCAINIGEFIETLAGEGTQTVALLEQYCEMVFQASQGVVGEKKLRRHLQKIETSVKTELRPSKTEIVFFPYQVSMWDSLESIYLAAAKDPQCDAYVVPIPWFEKNRDGTFGEQKYDGERYPAHIPITDWNSYNLEERRPDAIFTHNPYDGNSYVSSVHPAYYSTALKRYTGCLVYVDYGLPFWMTRDAIDQNLLPSFHFFDLAIVYSKEYANALVHNLKRELSPGSALLRVQESIKALGSPKFDAVVCAKREEHPLPETWKAIIAKRKVILFATSIAAVLKGGDDFVSSTREFLEEFRNNEDIAIWWRPHPFSDSAFSSMRPQLREQYKEIVSTFISEGRGVYDDTPDLHRAIVWSDACYSDQSSVVLLYLATGKPFTIRTFPAYHKDNGFTEDSNDFTPILNAQIHNMQSARGANIYNGNYVIWWHNFTRTDFANKFWYDDYWQRFSDFVLNMDKYPDAEKYRELKLKMLRECFANADGTAGQKIYDCTKNKIIGDDLK